MINVDELDDNVLNDIARNLGWKSADYDEDISKYLPVIAAMSPEEAFTRFLEWNGLIGYSNNIISALDNLKEASK